MRARPLRPLLAAAAALAAACASYGNVRFQPNPADVELAPPGAEPLGRALVSARGIRAAGDDAHELHLVLRLDNESGAPFELLADECELVDGSLDSLPPPRVLRRGGQGGEPLVVGAGETGVFELAFPFPPGRGPDDWDLSGLNLRWAVRAGERTARVSSSFERVRYPRHPDGYYAGFGYGCFGWPGHHHGLHGHYWHR